MALGLIKKQIIHTSNNTSSPLKLFGSGKRKDALTAATNEYNTQMQAYKDMEITNPYAENVYSNMENTAEDLTVNQQQAQFEAQQGAQQRANIMSNMAGAAGGSGVAGLAQAMANQGQLSTQRASASIGQQESANQRMAAQQAARNQQLERQGRLQVQQGAANVQQMKMDKQATMLGMSMQQVGNAQDAIAAHKAMMGNIVGGVLGAVGQIASAPLGATKNITNSTTLGLDPNKFNNLKIR